jgi:phage tail tape-measure protein
MDRQDETELERDDEGVTLEDESHETHATTGGAAAAGALTGGVIGLTSGPVGAAIGAVTGALVGVAAERMMHGEDDDEPAEATPEEPDQPAERVDGDDDIS